MKTYFPTSKHHRPDRDPWAWVWLIALYLASALAVALTPWKHFIPPWVR